MPQFVIFVVEFDIFTFVCILCEITESIFVIFMIEFDPFTEDLIFWVFFFLMSDFPSLFIWSEKKNGFFS